MTKKDGEADCFVGINFSSQGGGGSLEPLSNYSLGTTAGTEYLSSTHSLGLSLESSVSKQFSDFPIALASASQDVSSLLRRKKKKRRLHKIFEEEFFDKKRR